MSKNITDVTDSTFKQQVLDSKGVCLVDFWASWCGPCLMFAPVLEQAAEKLIGKAKICKLNIDDNNATPSDLGIMSIPTLVIFKDGKEQDRIVGAVGEGELIKRINKYIG